MRTTACTRGALRILVACERSAGTPLTMPEMAQRLGMTEALVVKACHRLMRAGYIAGLRGRGGGYRLARAAADITLFEIVELFEDENDLFPCRLAADGPCRLAGVCRLREICAEAWKAYADTLRAATIADAAVADDIAA
jgi:Rrf2 family nitric oxide-sensitive transcriptional repressor